MTIWAPVVAAIGASLLTGLFTWGASWWVERRRDRLAKAVTDFDAATIETTHGFCLHVLVGLGVAGDVERDVTFVDDVRDLLDEVEQELDS